MDGDGVPEPVGVRDNGVPAAVGLLLKHVHALVSLLFRAGLALDSSVGLAESAAGRAKAADGLVAVDAALLHTQSMTTALATQPDLSWNLPRRRTPERR